MESKLLYGKTNNNFDTTESRGEYLSNAISDLKKLIQVKDNAYLDQLHKSTVVVVTKVSPPIDNTEKLNTKIVEKQNSLSTLQIAYDSVPPSAKTSIQNLINDTNEEIKQFRNDLDEIVRVFEEQRKAINNELSQEGYQFETFSQPLKGKLIDGEKEKIKELIERSEYIETSKINTTLVISLKAKLSLIELANYVNLEIQTLIEATVPKIIKYCNENIDIATNYKFIKKYVENIENILDKVINSKTVNEFIEASQKLNILSEVEDQLSYLKFFQQYNSEITYNVSSWSSGLNPLRKMISKLFDIHDTLNNNGVLIIQGILINTEKVIEIIGNDKIHDITEVHIYALNTLFLDHDLISDKLKGINLVIAAPKEKINDKIKIVLKGKDGEAHPEPKAASGLSVEKTDVDGNGCVGTVGDNGKPGKPGGSGGNFYNFTKNIDGDLQDLIIDISGSIGGPGQNGGDGAKGSDSIKHGLHANAKIILSTKKAVPSLLKGITDTFEALHKDEGGPGGKGGDAGQGGTGGESGHIGKVKILKSGNDVTSNLTILHNQEKGINGNPGEPGIGGKNGSDYYDVRTCTDTHVGVTVLAIVGGAIIGGLTGGFAMIPMGVGVGAGALTSASISQMLSDIRTNDPTFKVGENADSGSIPSITNSIGKKKPKPTPLPDLNLFKSECHSYYESQDEMIGFIDVIGAQELFSSIE